MSKAQLDMFSSIIRDDKSEFKGSQYSKIMSDRISIKDALEMVHGGDPSQIPPSKGSKQGSEQSNLDLVTDSQQYCGEIITPK